MKVINYIIIVKLLLFSSLNCYSQVEEDANTNNRIFFGGNFGIVLGTYTQIEVSPYIGYRFLPSLWGGTGIIFQYYGSSGSYGNYSTAIYGSNTFLKFTLLKDIPSQGSSIFTYTGYEVLNLSKEHFKAEDERGRFYMHSILVGGGLRQYLGGRASAEILVLVNLSHSSSFIYQSPTIRVSLNL
jgi:hypothetical protein